MKSELISKKNSNTLILLLHGYRGDSKRLISLKKAIKNKWQNAKCLSPDMPFSLWSTVNPNEIIIQLIKTLNEEIQKANNTETPIVNIIFIGHSFGALLARKLYVIASGETKQAPFEPAFKELGPRTKDGLLLPQPWATNVSRLILLAGMNRGWHITHHLGISKAALWMTGALFSHIARLFFGQILVISTIRQGAEFITQLRIQWVRMRQQYKRNINNSQLGGAITIQLLGSIDDIVAPEDNIDLVSGGDFIYLDVPYSGHTNIIDLDHPVFGIERQRIFLLALTGSIEELEKNAIIPADEQFGAPNENIQNMVFVIHGIRDVGYWTHKIARQIKYGAKRTNTLNEWTTETSSYGYFPMLPFLFSWYRRRKVEWLMDQYTEALARYPNASFSYVGHSNGTYLLAKALELYPCCTFDKVVFAGSVVRSSYDWQRFMDGKNPQVKAVLNFVATRDWVVAFFPKFFEFLKWQDLGSAGHDGFMIAQHNPNIYQITYIKGGHGAAIQEPVWDTISNFVLTGDIQPQQLEQISQRRNLLVELGGKFPPLAWIIIGGLIFYIWTRIQLLINWIFSDSTSQQFSTGFALSAYILILWLILTRV
ncbi:hypothetical protein F908_02210 [Acinetobacter sp. NIPH 284]|uniref:alpha/beta hydrolase n=1 Tax=Acinetobacter sp. NIPH 284 TaxID=1217704 RepID=UPI0002CED089|nr:alpha/beta hydrolase [Acinetobacter sp. NIPH 284]ENW80013.1 hypothetical protein F908_02210 [Acinetobacter sp. NIPH 284]